MLILLLPAAWAQSVIVLAPNNTEPYTSFYRQLTAQLAATCQDNPQLGICQQSDKLQLQLVEGKKLETNARADQDNLILSLGVAAAEQSIRDQRAFPRIFALLPEVSLEPLLACCKRQNYPARAIPIDQPLERQLRLLKIVFPDKKRVGVLLGTNADQEENRLRQSLQHEGLELIVAKVNNRSELGAKLQTLLQQSDVLLALPDRTLYNDATIVSILLTTYRNQTPVIGYSEAMVKSGAIATVYISLEQQVAMAVRQIIAWSDTGRFLPEGTEPGFSISINRQVARSMGLTPPDEQSVQEQMMSTAP